MPLRWTAPEALFFRKYSEGHLVASIGPVRSCPPASDVWSFGILLYEIWTMGARPYGKWTNGKILLELDRGYRLPLPPNCPVSAYSLMACACVAASSDIDHAQLSTWVPEAASRPTFSQIADNLAQMSSDYQLKSVIETEVELQRLIALQKSFIEHDALTNVCLPSHCHTL